MSAVRVCVCARARVKCVTVYYACSTMNARAWENVLAHLFTFFFLFKQFQTAWFGFYPHFILNNIKQQIQYSDIEGVLNEGFFKVMA